jgi:site-specific DNA recombinase
VTKKKRLNPAAVYIRMSTDKQEESPAQQRAETKKLAASEGCEIVKEYKDDAITGDSGPERRPGFRAMLDGAERGEFQFLLLWDGDRLGRFDSLRGAEHYNRLRDSGVKIITCAEGPIDLDTFEGRIVHAVRQEGRHAYLKDLSRKVVRGKIANAKKGNHNGGAAHYGLDRALVGPDGNVVRRLDDGEWVKKDGHKTRLVPCDDPVKLEAVRYLFERFDSADLSQRALAREMNEKGYPSPRGMGWTHQNATRILKAPQYVGTARWGATRWGEYYTADGEDIAERENGEKGKWGRKAEEDTIRAEGAFDGIISPALFKRVQKKLRRMSNKRGKATRRNQYPLSGLIYCEHCGKPMRGETHYAADRKKTNKKAYRYVNYICSTYGAHGSDPVTNPNCRRHAIRAEEVQGWLVDAIREAFLGTNREALVKSIRQQLKAKAKDTKGERPRLEKRLAELETEMGRLVKALRHTDAPELVHELETARREKEATEDSLRALKQVSTKADLDTEAERLAANVLARTFVELR